jgi:hypothetical protein
MQVIIKEVILVPQINFRRQIINQAFQSNKHSINHASKQFKRSTLNAYGEF